MLWYSLSHSLITWMVLADTKHCCPPLLQFSTKTAEADTSSELAKKSKEVFRKEASVALEGTLSLPLPVIFINILRCSILIGNGSELSP